MSWQGPRPSDKDQKQWAPLLYFVHSVAGTVIAMMNKMGTFKLRINYGVKSVSDYLFNYVTSTLGCFIDTGDENNASRCAPNHLAAAAAPAARSAKGC